MIPYEFLFNYDYYCWRLLNPTEREIYQKNLDFYQEKIKLHKKKSLIVSANYQAFIQLFIDEGMDFIESISIKLPVLNHTESQIFEFQLTEFKDLKRLRLDPLNDYCIIVVERADLICRDGRLIDLRSHITTNLFIQENNRYWFGSSDPNLYFNDLDCATLLLHSLTLQLRYEHRGSAALLGYMDKQIALKDQLLMTEKNLYCDLVKTTEEQARKLDHDVQVIEGLEVIKKSLLGDSEELRHKNNGLEKNLQQTEQTLATVYNSLSWRLTKPLRRFKKIFNLKG
jgi:hypothetical protein